MMQIGLSLVFKGLLKSRFNVLWFSQRALNLDFNSPFNTRRFNAVILNCNDFNRIVIDGERHAGLGDAFKSFEY